MKNLFSKSGTFGNYIPGDDGSVSILLYGDIGEKAGVDSESIVSQLMQLSKEYSSIDVRINSNGGDVFSGFAIYNALKSCKANITIYVDGLAASMAGAIALCGKPVYMSRNARLMLHGVSVGIHGNKQELARIIDQIKGLEDSLADMLSARMQIPKEEVKLRFFDGTDHWFSAEEALREGLIDGISEPWSELKGLEVNNKNPQEIYSMYYNHFVNMNNPTDFLNKVKSIHLFSSMNETEIVDYLTVFAQNDEMCISSKAALQFACKRGYITEDECTSMYAILGNDTRKTAQYIKSKQDIYDKEFHNKYVEYMDEQTGYPNNRFIPAFVHDKEVENLAKHDFKAFKKMVERCPKWKSVEDYLGLPLSEGQKRRLKGAPRPTYHNDIDMNIRADRSLWGLEEYRKYAPEELRHNPKLYARLLEQEKNKNK